VNDSPDLFGSRPAPAAPGPATPRNTDSAGVRRTKRQLADITAGRHPLTRGPLHPDAPTDPQNRSTPGKRCGTCNHRTPGTHNGTSYPKCRAHEGRYLTHGAATDVRAWWPACDTHERQP